MLLLRTVGGFPVILPGDDPCRIVDAMLGMDYCEQFCVSPNFDPDFIAQLMKAGFLVMSTRLADPENAPSKEGSSKEGPSKEGPAKQIEHFILLPKLHLTRSVLFFDKLHIKNSIKRYLNRYKLCFDTDFNSIVDRCIEIHGEAWLTPPLISAIRNIRQNKPHGVYPASFALYQDEKLVAGEFGVTVGRVYTSYSGYYDESNAGTVQLILAARYMHKHGFAFFDLGMPLDYKTDLGATELSPQEFVALFRAAQEQGVLTPH